MRRLRIDVPSAPGESPASFTSRLAAANRLSAREFCLDWEIRFQAIVDGDPTAIAIVARLGGADVDALTTYAFRRTGKWSYEHRGQCLTRDALRRGRVLVCPACLSEDIRSRPKLAPPLAVYGRSLWQIEAIKTCPDHGTALVTVSTDLTPQTLHNFTYHVSAAVDRLDDLNASATRRDPSALERYAIGRLNGALTAPYLDAMPLYAATKVTELIGAVAVFGRTTNLKQLTDDEWWLAGGAGFEIAAGGVEGIHGFLAQLQATYPFKRPSTQGPQALFGRLYQVLAFGLADEAYDPLRDVIADYAATHLPLGPGDEIFGKPVRRRTLHSIRTLSVEAGLHPKRLRKVLRALGALDHLDPDLPDQMTIFPAEIASRAVLGADRALSLREAGEHLNAPRVHARLLADRGFIKPRFDTAAHGAENRYAVTDLDEFLERLFRDAVSIRLPKPGQVSIPAAAKRACCSAAVIVQLILDRKLDWVGRAAGERGYLAVLVDAAEIKEKTRGPDHESYTQRDVARLLGTTDRVVRALMKSKLLTTFVARDPVNHCPATLIHPDELARFTGEYVTLFGLAKERGRHFRAVLKELDAQGIEPAFDHDKIGTRIYRRSDVEVDN